MQVFRQTYDENTYKTLTYSARLRKLQTHQQTCQIMPGTQQRETTKTLTNHMINLKFA